MDVKHLLQNWQTNDSAPIAAKSYSLNLALYDAAKLEALNEMFPGRNLEQILSDLVAAALDELEESVPYVAGKAVIAEDDFGDPLYEDVGLSKRLHELTAKHVEALRA